MQLVIVHGGQTGVDRGAFYGAEDKHLLQSGVSPQDERDEHGPIPAMVRARLRPMSRGGLVERTRENVKSAHLVLVVVPSRFDPWGTPGTRQTLRYAREHGVKSHTTDIRVAHLSVAFVLACRDERAALTKHLGLVSFRLMVAGPRASLWPDGERHARCIVNAIGDEWYATQKGNTK